MVFLDQLVDVDEVVSRAHSSQVLYIDDLDSVLQLFQLLLIQLLRVSIWKRKS